MFKYHHTKGFFVAIDGPNGSGKSTLVEEIKAKMELEQFEVYVTREPSDSELGTSTRNFSEFYSGKTLACLIAADRYEHILTEILPELNKGKIVITDRYILSSLILQRMDDVDTSFILALNSERRAVPQQSDFAFELSAAPAEGQAHTFWHFRYGLYGSKSSFGFCIVNPFSAA